MSKGAVPKSKRQRKPTGRFAFCPRSGFRHELIAVEIFEGPRSFFILCPHCEVRAFFPDHEPGEGLTLGYVEAQGAVVLRLSPQRRYSLLQQEARAAAMARPKPPKQLPPPPPSMAANPPMKQIRSKVK